MSCKLMYVSVLVLSSHFMHAQTLDIVEILRPDLTPQGSFFYGLQFDPLGRLWVVGDASEMFFMENDVWTKVEIPDVEFSDFRDIEFAPNGDIWLATDGEGIFRYHNAEWTNFNMSNTFSFISDEYRTIAIDKNGKVYAGGFYSGLAVYDGSWDVHTYDNSNLPEDHVRELKIDNNGTVLWISNGDFVTRYNGTTFTTYDLYDIFGFGTNALDIVVDQTNKLFVATNSGLKVFQNNQWIDRQSWSGDRGLTNLLVEPDNDIWMTEVFLGLHYYNGDTLTTFVANDTIPDQIFDLVEDSTGYKYMVGNSGQQIVKFSGSLATSSIDPKPAESALFMISPTIVTTSMNVKSTIQYPQQFGFQIADLAGRIILTGKLQSSINLSALPFGNYVFTILDRSRLIYTRQFLKR